MANRSTAPKFGAWKGLVVMVGRNGAEVTTPDDAEAELALQPDERAFLSAIRAGLEGDPDRMRQALRRSLSRGRRLWATDNDQLRKAMLIATATVAPPAAGGAGPRSRDLVGGWRAPERVEGVRFAEPSLRRGRRPALDAQARVTPDLDRLPVGLDADTRAVKTPVLPGDTEDTLRALISEHTSDLLARHGLTATRTVLFTGPPGTGKTMTARWVASQLDKPLLVVNLASIMSHELGQSANNLTAALDAAEQSDAVLFIDEFDAIASQRGNSNDVGEMRRLVNVLLLRLDRWADGHLLIAATNHPELLDRAVNRRFEQQIELELPTEELRRQILADALRALPDNHILTLVAITEHSNGSELTTAALRASRRAALHDRAPELPDVLRELTRDGKLPKDLRDALIRQFNAQGMSLRNIGEIVGSSHVTVRKVLAADKMN